MNNGTIMALLAFAGALLVVLKPFMDLNTNITELKSAIDQFKESVNELKTRITEHGRDIDKMRESLVDHEARITFLEKK